MKAEDVTVQVQGDATFRRFTRRVDRHNMETGEITESLSIPVIEVIPDPSYPDRFVRLWLTPDGPILSNRDINF